MLAFTTKGTVQQLVVIAPVTSVSTHFAIPHRRAVVGCDGPSPASPAPLKNRNQLAAVVANKR
jgi:hypothetical protein